MTETIDFLATRELDLQRLDIMEMFHGIKFPGILHTQESLQSALKFQFQDTDIIIATYPKSGTTWMQHIVSLIFNRGDPETIPNFIRTPWLEHIYFKRLLELPPFTPRIFTTHLPYHLLGPALQGSQAKVIYVSRNPKDVAVSFYNFNMIARFQPKVSTFDEFLHQFLEDDVAFGSSWFVHFKDWTSQTATNLFHITYEEMSMDLRDAIKRVSSFVQHPLLDEELNNSVKHATFSMMKDNKMVNYTLLPEEMMDQRKVSFMRKGKTGDWKNVFTEEQNQLFKRVFESKMQNYPLELSWEI